MKRLVLCFDGTWSRLDAVHPTNVQITARSVLATSADGIPQIVYYDEGVGTDAGEAWTGGLFGAGLLKNLSDAYRFLIFNYAPGDQIYTFGFSRGAYTARSLAGLLSTCGLILQRHVGRADEAVANYRRRNGSPEFMEEMLRFRAECSPGLCISDHEVAWRKRAPEDVHSPDWPRLQMAYLGVWDTVGALGIPSYIALANFMNRKLQFHDVSLSPLVSRARHAVAIDERKRDFAPALWDNLDELNRRRGVDPAASDAPYQQVWFPGAHGSVGGGGGERRGLANIALDWVWEGARQAGLEFDLSVGAPAAEFHGDYRDVLVGNSLAGIVGFVLSQLPEWDRLPGPAALHEVSLGARQRWKEDPGNLPEGKPYRPPTLGRVANLIEEG